jgi:hypothetical protein
MLLLTFLTNIKNKKMKLFYTICFFLCSLIIFTSCKKTEPANFDTKKPAVVNLYTRGSTFCLDGGPVVKGIYTKDVRLIPSSNCIELKVEVIERGTYEAQTVHLNNSDYSFSAKGTFNNLGKQTIRLFGNGKPSVDGADSFKIIFNGDTLKSCPVTVLVYPPIRTSQFTINCPISQPIFYASFVNGKVLDPSVDSIEIPVTILQSGNYDIPEFTDINGTSGIKFSGSGQIINGFPKIALKASGTPTAKGIFTFKLVNGTSDSCTFKVKVFGGISCKIDGGPTTYFNINASAGFLPFTSGTLSIDGKTDANNDVPSINLVATPTGSFSGGTYSISTIPKLAEGYYRTSSNVLYKAENPMLTGMNKTFKITVSNSPATSTSPAYFTGTFSGELYNYPSTTNSVSITNGVIDVPKN